MASVGNHLGTYAVGKAEKEFLFNSLSRLTHWLEEHDYKGYDTFDGLNARFVRPLTFEHPLLRIVLQQGVRRFPLNLRPLLGVETGKSTKGMGFIARGYMRLHDATGDPQWRRKAEELLAWLMANKATGYHGACWANHFDYQSRNSYAVKGTPSIVWTTLIGHAFLDGYDRYGDQRYLDTAISACEHILTDLGRWEHGEGLCLGYYPDHDAQVHNANTLGGAFLARVASYNGNQAWREIAERSLLYTAQRQRADGSWLYGEASNLHWVDNFHTGYVLDCFKHFGEATGSGRFEKAMDLGYRYWKGTFFLEDGTPKYYNHKTYPLDIQCCSQAIDTLMFFADRDPEAVALAHKVAKWTIANMQDSSGYFYYRRYPAGIVNRTPTLHWGQATMHAALAALYRAL